MAFNLRSPLQAGRGCAPPLSDMMLRCMQGVSRLSRVQARSYYTTKLHEPIAPISNKRPTACSSDEAVQLIQSGMNVFLHTAAATPSVLVAALARRGRGGHLRDVTLTHIHTECEAEFVKPEFQGIFRSNSLFIGSNVRQAVNDGLADYTPIFLSEIPLLFRRGLVKLDAALVQVRPAKPLMGWRLRRPLPAPCLTAPGLRVGALAGQSPGSAWLLQPGCVCGLHTSSAAGGQHCDRASQQAHAAHPWRWHYSCVPL